MSHGEPDWRMCRFVDFTLVDEELAGRVEDLWLSGMVVRVRSRGVYSRRRSSPPVLASAVPRFFDPIDKESCEVLR